jgi:hypothetical protein
VRSPEWVHESCYDCTTIFRTFDSIDTSVPGKWKAGGSIRPRPPIRSCQVKPFTGRRQKDSDWHDVAAVEVAFGKAIRPPVAQGVVCGLDDGDQIADAAGPSLMCWRLTMIRPLAWTRRRAAIDPAGRGVRRRGRRSSGRPARQ